MIICYKKLIVEAIKRIEMKGIVGFTSKQLIENLPLPYKYIDISPSWLSECIKSQNYKYDKVSKLWVIDDQKENYVPKELYQKVKNKIDKLEIEIRKTLTNLLNGEDCYKCKSKMLCKYYNWDAVGLKRFIAIRDICPAHKKLIDIINSLGAILNE